MDGSTSYSSSLTNNLLIKTNNQLSFVISPQNIDEFYSEIVAYNFEQEV